MPAPADGPGGADDLTPVGSEAEDGGPSFHRGRSRVGDLKVVDYSQYVEKAKDGRWEVHKIPGKFKRAVSKGGADGTGCLLSADDLRRLLEVKRQGPGPGKGTGKLDLPRKRDEDNRPGTSHERKSVGEALRTKADEVACECQEERKRRKKKKKKRQGGQESPP